MEISKENAIAENDNVIYQEGTSEPIASAAPTADEKANAALIAAAPELLAALKTLCDWADSDPDRDQYDFVQHARAAIAKARGEK